MANLFNYANIQGHCARCKEDKELEVIIKLDRFMALLLIAGVVAILTRRLRVPYSVGLVFAGIILSLFPFFSDIPFTKDLIFNVFLPPLVFEAAIQIHWKELTKAILCDSHAGNRRGMSVGGCNRVGDEVSCRLGVG